MNTLNGTAYILWIDTVTPLTAERGDPDEYRPVMCGISNGFAMDIESISTRNKSDGGYDQSEAGYLTWNFDMDGHAIGIKMTEKAIKANFQEIAELALNKSTFWTKMEDLESTITREGKTRISSYRETAGLEEPYSFTANFIGVGKPIMETDIIKTVLSADSNGDQLLSDGENNLIEDKDGN